MERKRIELDNEEIRTWAENIEDHENIEEKGINTPEISPSSSGSTESSEESEELEHIEPRFDYYFEELRLNELFKENIEHMALNIIKPRFFEGQTDEDPAEWVKEFNRAAEANEWTNDDADNNLRLRMAKAHLKGEAADWCDDNAGTLTRWNNGPNNNQMAQLIVTQFATGHRKQQWLQQFEEIRQKKGESVEEFTKRFNKAVRKVGNDVTEVGKASAYTR